jgi:hypothetical protein
MFEAVDLAIFPAWDAVKVASQKAVFTCPLVTDE